jgi:ADP-ribose pyrophosphatase YjhB (NUDIX family)
MGNKIVEAFLYNDKLKFSEIEKLTNLRSNSLAYHLKNLEDEKVIIKEEGNYSLSSDFEHMIPYVSDKQAVLPSVLIAIGKGDNFFLHVRKKKPYKDILGLPAGRLLVGEKIGDAVRRIMKTKHRIDAKLNHINSISLEHLRKNGKIIHSFLLILVSASTKDGLQYIDINENKNKIIKSDYWLLKNDLQSKSKINTINSNIY